MTNIDTYRDILALAARRYPKLPLINAIDRATRDYCDNPDFTDEDLDRIAEETLNYFNSI